MQTRDFPAEIRTLWGMNPTELSSINFEPINAALGTTPSLTEDGKVRIDIKFNPVMPDEILWHEGAHVYLFHLGYPPCWFGRISEPGLLGQPLEFVNEYLATRLEIDRRYGTQRERVAVLRERLNHALVRLPMRELHTPQPGAGELAVSAAMCATIARQWTSTLALEAAEKFARTTTQINAIYWNVTAAIQHVPSIPFGSPRLANETVEAIKSLVSTSFNMVYGGTYTIRFAP